MTKQRAELPQCQDYLLPRALHLLGLLGFIHLGGVAVCIVLFFIMFTAQNTQRMAAGGKHCSCLPQEHQEVFFMGS